MEIGFNLCFEFNSIGINDTIWTHDHHRCHQNDINSYAKSKIVTCECECVVNKISIKWCTHIHLWKNKREVQSSSNIIWCASHIYRPHILCVNARHTVHSPQPTAHPSCWFILVFTFGIKLNNFYFSPLISVARVNCALHFITKW